MNWTKGNRGSSSMHPGAACVACHRSDEGPIYSIAGTLYPSAHEPDDCNGRSGGAKIVVTDANDKSYTITPNAVGNFVLSTKLTMPYRAKVVVGTKVREMASPQTNGDCNVCHTEAGTQKAPGRVMMP